MWLRIVSLQKWMSKNRLIIWWVVFIPLVALVLACNFGGLVPDSADVHNATHSLQFKIFDSVLLIVLARIILVALGVVILMLCLLFPVLQVGKEGIQWTKELENVLTEATSEIAGEEIGELITQEAWRWTLIHGWLRIHRAGDRSAVRTDVVSLVRDLLDTVWKAFPSYRLAVCLTHDKQQWALIHPLLPQLIPKEPTNFTANETVIALEMNIAENQVMELTVYPQEQEGFSKIDERFLLVLSEIFTEEAVRSESFYKEILEHFERIPLTTEAGDVYDGSTGGDGNGGE